MKSDSQREKEAKPLPLKKYSPEKVDNITNFQQVTQNSLVKDKELDATFGQYDDSIRLNYNFKSFKIGEKRKERAKRTAVCQS